MSRVIIDASGDADVAAWAGVPFEKSEDLLYPSLMFRINGVDVEAADVPGQITIGVRYTVRANNTRFNLVYPFYLNEAEGRRP